jgi:hypothetical protein
MRGHLNTNYHDFSCKGVYINRRGHAHFSSILNLHFKISSDVISDMRINVLEEGSDKVLWYKVSIY